MARVTTYLNFMGNTEEAFEFYKSVFGTEFEGPLMRMGDVTAEGMPEMTDAEKKMIMHIELPILGGHMLMGTDMIESMGHSLQIGNNVTLNLEPDTEEETRRLFAALSEGGSDCVELEAMYWGALWGTFLDRFGIRWMFNFALEQPADA